MKILIVGTPDPDHTSITNTDLVHGLQSLGHEVLTFDTISAALKERNFDKLFVWSSVPLWMELMGFAGFDGKLFYFQQSAEHLPPRGRVTMFIGANIKTVSSLLTQLQQSARDE